MEGLRVYESIHKKSTLECIKRGICYGFYRYKKVSHSKIESNLFVILYVKFIYRKTLTYIRLADSKTGSYLPSGVNVHHNYC